MDYLMAGIAALLVVDRIVAEVLHHRERRDWMMWSKSETAEDLSIALPIPEKEVKEEPQRYVPLEDMPVGE